MSLEQLSSLAQIISAAAVVASLIFVGLQLRHAAAAIRVSSSQAHSSLYTDLVQSIIDHADFARIWTVGIGDPKALQEDEWVRFIAYASALFRLYKSSRVQWLNKRLDDEHWQTIERQAAELSQLPGLRSAWSLRGHWYSSEFRSWLEGLVPQQATGPYSHD